MMLYIGTLRGKTTPELFREVFDDLGFTVYMRLGSQFDFELNYFYQEFTIPPIPLYQHIISLLPAETQQSPTHP